MSVWREDERKGGAAKADGFVLSEFLPYRIVSVGHLISRRLAETYESENLTIPEWRVIAVIAQADAMAARDVVALTPLDKMAVSRAVASLEAKGLVTRQADARDRRVFTLSLSAACRALFRRAARKAMQYERDLLAALTRDEQAAFRTLLARIEDSAAVGAKRAR